MTTQLLKTGFGTAADSADNTRYLFVSADRDFQPLFAHTAITHIKDGDVYRIPFPLSAEHEQALKANNKVKKFHYV